MPPAPTVAQQAFIADTTERFGDAISRGTKPGPLVRQACSSAAWCDPPLRGGIRLIYAGAGTCSAGFVVEGLSSGNRYLSTAGHCVATRTGMWSTHFADGSKHDIGTPHSYTNDLGLLWINNPTGWRPGPYIRIHTDPSYRISGWGPSAVGQRVCFTGGFTDSNCATVTGGLATRDGTPNTYRASTCAQPGDSGGAMFAANNAYGSLIGGYSSCDIVYYSAAKFSVLNVAPATTP